MLNPQRDEFVNVFLRIRPSTSKSCVQIISQQPPILLVLDRKQTYSFDNIFAEDIDQQTIYNVSVAPLVDRVRTGYNSTVFAYGQTGTGKTYTIGTDPKIDNDKDIGIISRALDDFFSNQTDHDVEVSVSFIEIYNEKVFDLLSAEISVPLSVKGFKIQECSRCRVYDKIDALTYLDIGCQNRHTGEMKQNFNSSRSHAIFTIYYNTNHIESKLTLVDLAGSESVKKTGNCGNSFQEGININKGLLSLGQVIKALSSNSKHIPYRQSIITTILKDSLDKCNFISLITCISSNIDDIGETCNALDFARNVKKMRNKPEINQIINQYRNDNPGLFLKTPMARTSTMQYETIVKRTKYVPKTFETSSKSISTCSTINEIDFSPIIKKYMDAIEKSLMNRFQDLIETTVQQSKRRSTRLVNKENHTPELPWDKIRDCIRQEVVQATTKATSSPLVEKNKICGRKLFDVSPIQNNNRDITRTKRFSVRLQLKQQEQKNSPVTGTCSNRRKSVRLPTPYNGKAIKDRDVEQNIKVFNILNRGNIKELQKLPTVGPKTALIIYNFRQQKGGFQAISDLANMPQWTQTQYERFCLKNFVIC